MGRSPKPPVPGQIDGYGRPSLRRQIDGWTGPGGSREALLLLAAIGIAGVIGWVDGCGRRGGGAVLPTHGASPPRASLAPIPVDVVGGAQPPRGGTP